MTEKKERLNKEQLFFSRALGLFLVLYAFLIWSQPLLYGFDLPISYARIIGVLIFSIGGFLALRK